MLGPDPASACICIYIIDIFYLIFFLLIAAPLISSAKRDACGDIFLNGPDSKLSEPRKSLSCHQCKCTQWTDSLVVCTAMVPSGRPCRNGYCRICLKRLYEDEKLEKNAESWKCFACRNICSCSVCRKQSSNCAPNPAKVTFNLGEEFFLKIDRLGRSERQALHYPEEQHAS